MEHLNNGVIIATFITLWAGIIGLIISKSWRWVKRKAGAATLESLSNKIDDINLLHQKRFKEDELALSQINLSMDRQAKALEKQKSIITGCSRTIAGMGKRIRSIEDFLNGDFKESMEKKDGTKNK